MESYSWIWWMGKFITEEHIYMRNCKCNCDLICSATVGAFLYWHTAPLQWASSYTIHKLKLFNLVLIIIVKCKTKCTFKLFKFKLFLQKLPKHWKSISGGPFSRKTGSWGSVNNLIVINVVRKVGKRGILSFFTNIL